MSSVLTRVTASQHGSAKERTLSCQRGQPGMVIHVIQAVYGCGFCPNTPPYVCEVPVHTISTQESDYFLSAIDQCNGQQICEVTVPSTKSSIQCTLNQEHRSDYMKIYYYCEYGKSN